MSDTKARFRALHNGNPYSTSPACYRVYDWEALDVDCEGAVTEDIREDTAKAIADTLNEMLEYHEYEISR